MRCNDAILSAFLSHPIYQTRQDIIETGTELTQKNWAFAYYLPPDSANYALNQCLKKIVKEQRPTGLWGKKYYQTIDKSNPNLCLSVVNF